MIDKIKNCPFCGGKAEEDDYTNNKHMVFGTGWIGCRSCRVFINYINGERGRRLAISAWNRRAENEVDDGKSKRAQ